ncbi:MAG: two-component regulator propeller domain-containing protein [Bacteriovoracaceae bacterium]
MYFSIIQINLSAQQFTLESIPSSNTLSANSVYALLRDKEGFLWVGTQNGLNRYDGRQFKYFVHDNNDSTTLSDNFIITLSEDSTGNIWVGTRHGLNRFDKRTQTFQRFYLMDFAENASHQTVYSLTCAPDGRTLAVAGGKIYTLSSDDRYTVHQYDNDDSVMCIAFNPQGSWMIAHRWTIEGITTANQKFGMNFISPSVINTILASQQMIFVGSVTGLWMIDKGTTQTDKIKRPKLFLKNVTVNALSLDAQHRLWIGTEKGIYVLGSDGQLEQVNDRSSSTEGTTMLNSRALIFDRFGLIWIGMLRNGVRKYDPSKEQFQTIDKKNLGIDGVVWSILQDTTGVYWFGTQRGVYQFRKEDTLFRHPVAWKNNEFKNIMISELMEDSRGSIWMGSRPGGLYHYSPRGNMIKHFLQSPNDSSSLVNNSVSSVFESANGLFYLTTSSGICSFDPVTKKFSRIMLMDTIQKKEVTYFLHVSEDRDFSLWISSSSGLFLIDQRTGTYAFYSTVEGDSTSLSYNIVASTTVDVKGNIWVATLGGGVNVFDKGTKKFTRFNSSDGLINDVVYGILEDSYGRMWMSTDFGLACFDPETKKFLSFGKEDGLEFIEFSQNSFYKNSTGTMFFGGIGGAVKFQPELITAVAQQSLLVVSDLRINYESISPGDPSITMGTITTPQEVHITYEQQALSIDFTSLNFRFPEKTFYAYRLQGFYDYWVYPAEHQRTAHYTHLPPGEYFFEVKTSTQKGEWGKDEMHIRIVVHPPFWRTWWFMLFSSLSAVGLFYSGVRFVSQRKLKQQLHEIALQQKVNAERERISRDLHDSTGSNIAGIISGLNLAERYLETSKPKTKRTLQLLTNEARAGMSQLRETILAMKTVEMSVDELADTVNEMITKQLQFRKKIAFQLTRDYPHSLMLSSIQGLHLMRIFEEALSNALNHATAKNIEVRIELRDGKLIVQLCNDGKKKKQRSMSVFHGNGIPNMKRRADEIGALFSLECDDDNGSVMTVSLPFQ